MPLCPIIHKSLGQTTGRCYQNQYRCRLVGPTGQGFGLIARDHEGICQVAATKFDQSQYDPLTAEFLALKWSVQQAIEWNIHVIYEMDSSSIHKALLSRESHPSLSPVLQDCTDLVQLFDFCSFSLISRKANSVAHLLASLAFQFDYHVWWNDVPVTNVIVTDIFHHSY